MDQIIFTNRPVCLQYFNMQSATTTCILYSTFCSLTNHINTLCIQQWEIFSVHVFLIYKFNQKLLCFILKYPENSLTCLSINNSIRIPNTSSLYLNVNAHNFLCNPQREHCKAHNKRLVSHPLFLPSNSCRHFRPCQILCKRRTSLKAREAACKNFARAGPNHSSYRPSQMALACPHKCINSQIIL